MKNLYGYILEDRSNHYNWNTPYPILTNFNDDILILPNNTLTTSQDRGARDHGYGNLHIFSTTPNIGDIIDPSEIIPYN
ncbi:unnamed protein product [Rhizophagus irregularis]|uniref:Uncharacterized protein n=1 Tax=Rhizophagus irregularis TaxID=588596 RepID=A0A915ZJA7_9GLOM|nr:unnamed protein product [Rhizophagus irregularis]CAB5379612.1 unnamed protein product [Rhizophagus irregularis]